MKVGTVADVAVERVAFGGEGVCRIHDMVVFVPFTMRGDKATVEIVGIKKRYARGRMIRLLDPSRERTVPPCRYYTQCGGCQYQHIRYDVQLEIKQQQVMDTFTRIGRFGEAPVRETMRSPLLFGYRGKAEFQIVRDDTGRWISGFMESSSHRVIDIESCMIMDDSINASYRRFREDILSGKTPALHEERRVFWSRCDGEVPMRQIPGTLVRIVKSKPVLVSHQGFFQANTGLTAGLIDVVVSMCNLTGRETVLDAFCGSGLFSLFLAEKAETLYGIEIDPEAVKLAGINLREAGYTNATFMDGDVAAMIRKQLIDSRLPVDVMVCDPPRLGLYPRALAAIVEMGPARIVYVSCNPATQARDMRFLADRGYALKGLQPIDMFPHTAHIEVVGLMEKT